MQNFPHCVILKPEGNPQQPTVFRKGALQYGEHGGLPRGGLRESNEKLVKRFLMEYGECTKMDIAGGLGLSHPTVAKVLADMAARGEAESAGKEDSLGGRSGEKYRLNYDHTHVLAIILTMDRLQYRVVNLARRTKEEGSLPSRGRPTSRGWRSWSATCAGGFRTSG